MEDNDLIKKYLEGDESSLEIIIGRYLKPIYNFVYHFTGNNDETEDVVQDTFLKVWKNLKKYDQKKNFKIWLYSIARNTAIDHLRKKKNIPFSFFRQNIEDEGVEYNIVDKEPDPENLAIIFESKKNIDKMILKLPELYREVIVLRHQNDLTFTEMANILKKPENTIRSNYRRAILFLRKMAGAQK